MDDGSAIVHAPALGAIVAAALLRLLPEAFRDRAEVQGLRDMAQALAADDNADTAARLACALLAPAAADAGLASLAGRLGFTPVDVLACVLARDAESDPRMAPALSFIQGTPMAAGPLRPTAGLVARLLAGRDEALAAQVLALGRARAWSCGVLSWVDEDEPLARRSFRLHGALLEIVCGDDTAQAAEFGPQRARLFAAPPWPLPASWRESSASAASLLRQRADVVLVARSRNTDEAAAALACVAAQSGASVALISGFALTRSGESGANTALEVSPALEVWLIAGRRIPLLQIAAAPGESVSLPAFRFYRGPVLVASGLEGDLAQTGVQPSASLRLDLPTAADRTELLLAAWGGAADGLDIEAIARRYRRGVSALWTLAGSALLTARAHGESLGETHIRGAAQADLSVSTQGLGALAQRIGLSAEFIESREAQAIDRLLVAPPKLTGDLLRLARRCRLREGAADGLGELLGARYSPGVRALLTGPSGTGKTLAVQWLAAHLGKPLFRVDLAAVSSKYIGDTEKNLSALLSAAEQLDCVLLFDEADALFGSRTEVRQANDRFANAQTNYLLQRIESFEGIAILTANSRARFDEAFMRRLDEVLEFPLPSVAERRTLWEAHLGPTHTLSPGELNRLAAEIELAGGHVRNIVLSAALAAATEGGRGRGPALRDVAIAAATEYAKLGRLPPDALIHAEKC